jgi:hypothetical protein
MYDQMKEQAAQDIEDTYAPAIASLEGRISAATQVNRSCRVWEKMVEDASWFCA